MGTGAIKAGVLEAVLTGSNVPIYFIAERQRFGDRPFFYGYKDDPYRFAFFSRAALDLVIAALGWRPDIVHAHDWHTAPAVTWLATAGQTDPRYAALPTLYTIHNLRHQGNAPWHVFQHLGLLTHGLAEERFGEVNFMARGIYHATMVSTVSPTYAREIMTYEGGSGLDKLLRHRHLDVHGILNGLDYEVWNPATDRHLAATFDATTLERRKENKRAPAISLAGLPTARDDAARHHDHAPRFPKRAWTSPAMYLHLLADGYAGEAQCIVLGAGAAHYEDMLRHLSGFHQGKMTAFLSYDAELAPLIYGGGDIFLMPSLFEPVWLGPFLGHALRLSPGGARRRGTRRHGPLRSHWLHVPQLFRRRLLEFPARSPIYLAMDRDSWRALAKTRYDQRFLLGGLGPRVSTGLSMGDFESARLVEC